MQLFFKTAAAALALAVLSGCGALTREAPGPCPVAVAVDDAARMTRFQPGGSDLTEVDFEVVVEGVAYGCEYDGTEAVEMVVEVALLAAQGPANASDSADFTYFIAVATADRQILAREDFTVSIPFQGNLTRVRLTETLEPRIPLRSGETGANYRVFVGLALTEAELQYNRSRP